MYLALGQLRAVELLPTVVNGLRDPAAEVREEVLRALMFVGDGTCVSVLVETLKDSAPAVRKQAARVLRHLAWQPANPTPEARQLIAFGL